MNVNPFLLVLVALAGDALAQSTQHEAFEQGKGYRADNARAASAITTESAAGIPGKDAARERSLQDVYGTPMPAAGEAKVAECAAHVPGDDDYANQECATINYLQRHPESRPRMTVSRSEPAVTTGTAVRSAPRAFTAGQPGLSGTYTACVDRTTRSPERQDTERCLVGHAVTEGSCVRKLVLTYSWQPYAGQAGAELAHARCRPGSIRGDRIALPVTTAYRETSVPCAERGHGTGTERLVLRKDCSGTETVHGYDARRCSAAPVPDYSDPPRSTATCTTMPRTAAHCFALDGTYAGKSEAPVFEDHWDDSGCADFDRTRGPISN